ncbi:hypothetical protein MATL_G00165530 [Megalops atlanticus]|uniref:Transcriptional regulating factor 1 n=1 Tax=Megalops atlanticus TaxID=7932 RepID=A0A9D3PR92_MEGAT|nr:hypothetical protein MATL_G00165530 [Megalops atlanticus]
MADQPFYETNHPVSCYDESYFPQHNSMATVNQSCVPMLDSVDVPAGCPVFYQDPTDPHADMVDVSKHAGSWPSSIPGKTSPVIWGTQPQGGVLEASDSGGGYQFQAMAHANTDRPTKLSSSASALQRLDSFTQVFSQNLHLFQDTSFNLSQQHPPSGPVPPSLGSVHIDGVFRQFLDQGPMQPQEQPMEDQQSCPQMEPQSMRSYDQVQSQHLLSLQENQQQLHYGYQSLQQPRMGLMDHMQQVLQQQQEEQGNYYHLNTQLPTHPLPQPLCSTPPLPHYSQSCKVQRFPQPDPALSSHQRPYFYQDQHQYRPLYQHSIPLQQQVQAQDTSTLPVEQYSSDTSCALLSPGPNTPMGPSPTPLQGLHDPREGSLACQQQFLSTTATCSPHQLGERSEVDVLPTIQLANSVGGASPFSPRAPWQQMRLPNFHDDPSCSGHSTPVKVEVTDRDDATSKLLCSICQKEFKSLPALNGHMRSHGGFRALPAPKMTGDATELSEEVEPDLPFVMPVSVPVKLQPAPRSCLVTPLWPCPGSYLVNRTEHSELSLCGRAAGGERQGAGPEKKSRHRPDPLIIPSPIPVPSTGGAVLFQSQLRSPCLLGEAPPYTPPPMLSPIRQGSGLFRSICPGSLLTPVTPRVLLGRTTSMDGSPETVMPGPGEQSVEVEPRINIGSRFQADIPDVQRPSQAERDMDKACLLWTPLSALDTPATKQRVDDLVKMACSSVLPGGGTNTEYALHCLFECRGDIMASLEKLLLHRPVRRKFDPLVDYHYAGSDCWTLLEKEQLNKAFIIYNKDFFLIQKMVKTKTVAQCVEYYYTWKKRLRLGKKQQMHSTILEPERAVQTPISQDEWEVQGEELESEELDDEKSFIKQEIKVHQSPELADPASSFVCEVPDCGCTFSSKQALNGHAHIHSSPGLAPKPLAERCRSRSTPQAGLGSVKSSPAHSSTSGPAPQAGLGSVKSSPAHSSTSGDTDITIVFPCKECGKVFSKIKSRNAHMKTHRQPEDLQSWHPQKALRQINMKMAPGSLCGPPVTLLSLPFDHVGLVKQLQAKVEEEEDHMEEEDSFLKAHPMLQLEAGEFIPGEELCQ